MTVRRRAVWYFHGFDPAAAARYRRIFAAASARLGVEVGDLPDGAEGWRAVRGDTVTEVRLLRYEDLVRAWRAPPLWRRLLRGAGASGGSWRSGAMVRIARTAPRAALLAASPYLAILLPVAAAAPAFRAGPWAGVAALAAALGVALWLVRRSFLDVVADLFAWMRALAQGGALADSYRARIEALAGAIAADDGADEGADEVLVVGHSLGGIAAVLAVAEVLERVAEAALPPAAPDWRGPPPRPSPQREEGAAWPSAAAAAAGPEAGGAAGREALPPPLGGRVGEGGRDGRAGSDGAGGRGASAAPPLALLTLGSTHGIVLAERGPGRERLARAVMRVAGSGVFWVDVSSPRDAFCVALTDPLLTIGEAARPEMASPRVLSARLARAPRIPGDRRTVFAAMRRHMGYLLAPEPGSGFDYADTVTGPLTLRARFGGRKNSPRARMWRP